MSSIWEGVVGLLLIMVSAAAFIGVPILIGSM